MKHGPNMRRLIARRMATLAIPAGIKDPFMAGVLAITSPGALSRIAREATDWVEAHVAAILAAPDNTYPDAEAVAAAILVRVNDSTATTRSLPTV